MEKTTKKQQEFLNFIAKYIENYGYSPSIRDLCNVFERSPGSVHPMLKKLKQKGLITYEENKARTIKILN